MFALALLAAMAVITPKVYAHDEEEKGNGHLRFVLGVHNQSETENEDEGSDDENEFEIRGQVDSIGTGSFIVDGQMILIDPSQVDEFKQKGILNPGDWVKVEGIIIDGGYYAEKIMTIGEGQGRFQIKINSNSEDGEEDISPTPTPTPTESVSPTPTPTPTPTETPNIQVNVKANGPIALVTEFLQQVLAYLQGLIS